MGILIAGSSIETARIPELSPLTVDLPLDLADQIPVYIASQNLTKKVPLSVLNSLITGGGGGVTHPPVAYGGEYIYVVPPAANNTDTANLPAFSGLDFTMERGGFPVIPLLPDSSNVAVAEFEVLDSGGFKLLQSGDVLNTGERFKLHFFSLIGSGGPGTGSGSTFFQGKKIVTTNTTLDPDMDMNKVIQIRANATAITLTLPSVGDIAANSIIVIETSINNSKPTKIATTGGQFIYFNTVSKNAIDMHPGEVCWLFRDDDGLYVINDFHNHYRNLCKPIPSYEVGFDEVICKGQIVNRVDLPRIWEKASNLGFSLVSEATWNLASTTVAGRTVLLPNRACFSTGDGINTFRLPDMMNMALRGLKTETGSDTERYLNKPGGYQRHEYAQHDHGFSHGRVGGVDGTIGGGWGDVGTNNTIEGLLVLQSGGAESRGDNIGVYWVMKK